MSTFQKADRARHGRVSIITPVHNAAATLQDTVTSVLSQSWEDWELWLVDDASTDTSAKLIEDFCAADARIHGLSLRSQGGAAAARNLAIEHATGRYIAFLDADDLWDRHKLAIQIGSMPDDTGLCYSAYRRIDINGRLLGTVSVPKNLSYSIALRGNSIGCLTALYDTHVYGKIFMPDIPRRQDYALWLKLLRHHEPAWGVQECLASYRVRANSLSSNRLKAATATWHVFRRCENLGRLQSAKSLYFYFSSAVRKRL